MDLTHDLEQASQGNLEALGRVILESRPLALTAARKLARKAQRPDLIEDLMAAAIAGSGRGVGGLIAAARTFNPGLGSWEGYAYGHAVNAVKSEFRIQVELSRRSDEMTEATEPAVGSEDTMIAALDDKARLPRIARALMDCSHREQQVMERAIGGAAPSEIAAELGLHPKRVSGYLSTARDKLRSA